MKKLLTISLCCLSIASFAETTTIPAGSNGYATLITDINIPVQTDSVPVQLVVDGRLSLPNDHYSSAIKDCLIMGIAKGSLTTNKVHIDFEKMTCKEKTYHLSGWVVDVNHKFGLVATNVNDDLSVKQGQKVIIIFRDSVNLDK